MYGALHGFCALRDRVRRRARSDAGASTLATVISATIILHLMFLVVQAGLYWHAMQWAEAGADRAVARAAEANVGDRAAAGLGAAQNFLSGSAVCDAPTVRHVETDDAGTVSFSVTCGVRGPMAAWVPNARASATGPIERFVPETEREGVGT